MAKDDIKWFPRIQVAKWNPETVAAATKEFGHEPGFDELMQFTGTPDDMAYDEGNELTTAGLTAITGLLLGLGGQAFSSTTQAAIGVGATNTAFALGNTQLAGDGNSTTAWYQNVDATPSRTAGAMSASATFQSGNGNFAWNEWGWVTATSTITAGNAIAALSAGTEVLWNRKVPAGGLGTKVSGAVWTLSSTITLT
jgi:hypothetical protein